MTIDLCWQLPWTFAKENPAMFTAITFGVFWFLRFMVGHKLVALRCWLGLHKYEDWNMKEFDGTKEMSLQRVPVQTGHAKTFNATRYCNDCGRTDPKVISDRIETFRDGEPSGDRTYGKRHHPEPKESDK